MFRRYAERARQFPRQLIPMQATRMILRDAICTDGAYHITLPQHTLVLDAEVIIKFHSAEDAVACDPSTIFATLGVFFSQKAPCAMPLERGRPRRT